MARAGVFIGVDKTGNLQQLKDAAAGARRMYEWALAQGMTDGTHAKLITDERGATVHSDLIYDAIKELIDGPGVDQLIVYFAGHGVNISRSEHWLLTDAPRKTQAAVNVSGSVELARYCGIQHVVVISDACRVAPEGIQAQNVRGVDIFPNDAASDRAKPVDQFFACALGRTAAELKDPRVAAGNYTALYTNAMLDALHGAVPDILDPGEAAGDSARYVKPRKLENYLETEVPRRVKAMKLEKKINQNPDAIILDHPNWLARIDRPIGSVRSVPVRTPRSNESVRSITQTLVQNAADGDRIGLNQQLQRAEAGRLAGAKQLAGTAQRLAVPFGPDHFETECGIKIRGARLVEFFAPRARAELLGTAGDLLRIHAPEHPAASVLLRFEGNFGTVIPAIPGFLAALTFDDGELVDVAYEPSTNSWRWEMYKERAADIRALRSVAASSSQHGRFRLEQPDAEKVAQRMQFAKGIDLTLAVYAAYAYHDLQAVDRLRAMAEFQRGDIGVTFFDIPLLGRTLIGKSIGPNDGIVPFTPLLSQGWPLLRANRVALHPALDGIERTMRDSLWSLFDASGLDKLQAGMRTLEVR